MRIFQIVAVLLVVSGVLRAEDKGHCPASFTIGKPSFSKAGPPKYQKPKAPEDKPAPDADYLGKVHLMVGVSDKGYVCDVTVSIGIDPKLDEGAVQRMKARHFPPVMQRGEAVAATMFVPVQVWRMPDGKIVDYPQPKLPQL